jgi:hypothetical protein
VSYDTFCHIFILNGPVYDFTLQVLIRNHVTQTLPVFGGVPTVRTNYTDIDQFPDVCTVSVA